MKIYAKLVSLDNCGTEKEQAIMKQHRFREGQIFITSHIYVGGGHSIILLEGYGEEEFNSVFFEFFNEVGENIDIYSIQEYQVAYFEKYKKPYIEPVINDTFKPKRKKNIFMRIFF